MSEPTRKHPQIENPLSAILGKPQGRIIAIRTRLCVPAPIGCGKPVTEFTDRLSEKEYTISGLCQSCQDKTFVPPHEEDYEPRDKSSTGFVYDDERMS